MLTVRCTLGATGQRLDGVSKQRGSGVMCRRQLRTVDTVAAAEAGDELVLLDVVSGIYFGLDPVGTRIWQLLEQGVDEDTLIAQLLEEYDVDESMLRADTTVLLDQLIERGLITATGGPS